MGDPREYVEKYPDLTRAFGHKIGKSLNRKGNKWDNNPTIREAAVNHYYKYGRREGRHGRSPLIDPKQSKVIKNSGKVSNKKQCAYKCLRDTSCIGFSKVQNNCLTYKKGGSWVNSDRTTYGTCDDSKNILPVHDNKKINVDNSKYGKLGVLSSDNKIIPIQDNKIKGLRETSNEFRKINNKAPMDNHTIYSKRTTQENAEAICASDVNCSGFKYSNDKGKAYFKDWNSYPNGNKILRNKPGHDYVYKMPYIEVYPEMPPKSINTAEWNNYGTETNISFDNMPTITEYKNALNNAIQADKDHASANKHVSDTLTGEGFTIREGFKYDTDKINNAFDSIKGWDSSKENILKNNDRLIEIKQKEKDANNKLESVTDGNATLNALKDDAISLELYQQSNYALWLSLASTIGIISLSGFIRN